jgi:uncharacterized ion transporter superfamily protein YfcC
MYYVFTRSCNPFANVWNANFISANGRLEVPSGQYFLNILSVPLPASRTIFAIVVLRIRRHSSHRFTVRGCQRRHHCRSFVMSEEGERLRFDYYICLISITIIIIIVIWGIMVQVERSRVRIPRCNFPPPSSSSRAMTLRSTQPLTGMSTKTCFCGV